jgi:hypothetical protein
VQRAIGASSLRILLLTAVALAWSTAAPAQTVSDGRVWWNATLQERAGTSSPWRWYLELQGRYRDGLSDSDQFIVRPAIGFDLTRRSSLWAGYGYIATYPAGAETLDESRAWQQYLWNGPALGGTAQWRSRLEQRAIEGNDDTAWRARQFWRLTKPVATGAGLAIVVWDEVFVHLNDTIRTKGGFDQNRLFAGVGLNAGPQGRFEVGYLHQAIEGGRGVDRRHHAVLAFLNLTY